MTNVCLHLTRLSARPPEGGRRKAFKRALHMVGMLFCLAALCAPAAAQTRDVARAAEAFGKAQQAELRGDFQEAAGLYALADELAPADGALRGAARMAQRAGMNATAATHAAALL